MTSLALYTTVYPGVESFLADWHASVARQTDADFRLWIGLDVMDVEAATAAMGAEPDAVWVQGIPGDTPGSLRQRALAQVVERHDAVVLVDSDDLLHPSRVATARAMLAADEFVGCPLRVVDVRGAGLGMTFAPPAGADLAAIFPHTNAFGMSNSAVRAGLLERCMPIPAAAVLVDWYLATRAWLFGARFAYGDRVEMDYRQYGANTARVRGPYPASQVAEDADLVVEHYRLVRASDLSGARPDRLAALEAAAEEVDTFKARVVGRGEVLSRYVAALNELGTPMLWWAWVAHPALRHLWATEEGE